MKNKELYTQAGDYKPNRIRFGLGTLGRDMLYTAITTFLLTHYFAYVLGFEGWMWIAIGTIITIVKVIDAFNDPFMGVIIDNTKSKWGKFKPWILWGGIAFGLLTIGMYSIYNLDGIVFIIAFAVMHVVQEIAFTLNDIAYWSMVPSLTKNPKEKNIISSVARICANIGAFSIIVLLPILISTEDVWKDGIVGGEIIGRNVTGPLVDLFNGNYKLAYLIFMVALVLIAQGFQLFNLIGIKEKQVGMLSDDKEEKTTIKDIFRIIFKNDQLLVVAIAMLLINTAFQITVMFGVDYFTLVYKNAQMYSMFAAVLGVSQILGLVFYPLLCKKMPKKKVFMIGAVGMIVGYLAFFFSPANMIFIGISGFILFVGQGFMQALIIVFITDSIEYGHLKFKKRNESVSFAVQPFVYKISSAIGMAVITITFALPFLSGVRRKEMPEQITALGEWTIKGTMLLIPAILVLIAGIIFYKKYKIDEKAYEEILLGIKQLDGK